jgi:UDP-2,4-diacetamido-2,4,6-trideoxy-beta-L-altropyranose hydrolase
MKMIKKILLRFDATKEIGMGHAMRVQSLVDALKDKTDINLVICGEGEGIKTVFKDLDIYSLNHIHKIDYDIAIQDIVSSEIGLKNNDKPLIVIDDFGGNFNANLILNGSVLAHKNLYKGFTSKTKFLCGGQYSLLRKAFLKPNQIVEKMYDLTIVAGSGIKASEWVASTFQQLENFTINHRVALIVGRQFIFPSNFQELIKDVDFYQSLDAQVLAQKLQQSHLVLVTGGMIMYEAIALGVPILVYPNVENQLDEISFFVENNVTENLMHINALEDHLIKLLNDEHIRQERLKLGQKLIDGHGAKRAAKIIYEQFFT